MVWLKALFGLAVNRAADGSNVLGFMETAFTEVLNDLH